MFESHDVANEWSILESDLLAEKFRHLSDGHKAVLLTITRLVETVEERTLVVLDEPEAHLHPPLLSAFIRALSALLRQRNAVAIVATHSPVVLQEVPKGCVQILRREGDQSKVERPDIDTFGEDVGRLTHEIFGLEVQKAGFHVELERLSAHCDTYEEALSRLGGGLGFEGRSILRSFFALKRGVQ